MGDSMSIAPYDLGIHLDDVDRDLQSVGAVTIVGYERSGKSTLAEILAEEARGRYATVIHQNARTWLWGERQRIDDASANTASIDAELAAVVSKLEGDTASCWVVD